MADKKENKFFKLSPIEERPKVLGRLVGIVNHPGLSYQDDRAYVAALLCQTIMYASILVALFLMGLIFYAEVIRGYDFGSQWTREDYYIRLGFPGFHAYYHGMIMGWVVIVMAFVYAVFYFLATDKKTRRVFLNSPVLGKNKSPSLYVLFKSLCVFLFIGALGCFLSFHTSSANAFILRWTDYSVFEDSVFYMLFYTIFGVVGHMAIAAFIYMSTFGVWGILTKAD